jgi:hypothetical protein
MISDPFGLKDDLFTSFSGSKLLGEKDGTRKRGSSYFSRRRNKMRKQERKKEELNCRSREAKLVCSGKPGCLIECCSYLMEGAAQQWEDEKREDEN